MFFKKYKEEIKRLQGVIQSYEPYEHEIEQYKSLVRLNEDIIRQIDENKQKLNEINRQLSECADKHQTLIDEIVGLNRAIRTEYTGFKFDNFDIDDDYTSQDVREAQKEWLSWRRAWIKDKDIARPQFEGSDLFNGFPTDKKHQTKMMKEFCYFIGAAFNAATENILNKYKYYTHEELDTKLCSITEYYKKICDKYDIVINEDFVNFRRREIYYKYKYLEKIEEEKEERRRQAEIIKEQDKVEREINRELKRLEQCLKETKEGSSDRERIKKELDNLLYRKNNPKAGYVYFISNPDMKDGLIKIGITRRTVEERINELSDASHAFKFNIHGYVFTNDCFNLEARLHQYFADRRFNQTSAHKEHFFCTCEECEDALKSFGYDVRLNKNPTNTAYDESIYILKENKEIKKKYLDKLIEL